MPSITSRFLSRFALPSSPGKNRKNSADFFKSFILALCCASSAAVMAVEDAAVLSAKLGANSSDGQQTASDFTIGVQSATTSALVDTVLNTEAINITGRINPQADHIGKQVDIFVVDSVDSGLIMKTADGQFLDWSGDVNDLEPAITNAILTDVMVVDVFTGVLDNVGNHSLYLGYRVEGDSALIYNATPAALQVVPEELVGTSSSLTTDNTFSTATLSALTGSPALSLSRYSTTSGGSITFWWGNAGTPCTASSSPANSSWSGSIAGKSGSKTVSPTVTTVFTLACANGSISRTVTVNGVAPPPPPPPPPPPTSNPPALSLSTYSYNSGGSATVWWGNGTAPCTTSASPAYSGWSGAVSNGGSKVISPTVTTVLTFTCANGSISRTLTVNGGTTPPPAPGDIVPLPVPLTRTLAPMTSSALDVAVLNFSHTANREWDYGGHNVPDTFSGNGYWAYTDGYIAAWLFDRPTSWFRLYALTNNPAHREYAIRDTAWYASRINSSGYFIPKVLQGENDTKYGYVTPFLLYERLTGNTQYRTVAQKIYQASVSGYSSAYPITAGLWTEREAGIHGEAALSWYELTKEQAALNRAGAIVRQVGQLAAANGGAPQVPYWRHEGGGESFLTNSPWMTAIYFQFARRYYEITGDQAVLRQVSAYFDWLDVNGLYDSSLLGTGAGMTIPRYLTGPQSGDAVYSFGDPMHCLDVAGIVAFSVDAKQRLGLSTTRASQRLTELKSCATTNFNNWTRTTTNLPKYRITPERAWMWWMKGRYELLP